MLVEAQVTIHGTREAVWAVMTEIERSAEIIRGIDKIEVLEKPAGGLVGLKWRETRLLFGKPAAADKWITDVVEREYFRTRAEDGGFAFITTLRIAEVGGAITLIGSHESRPLSFKARLSVVMLFLFKGVIRKAALQDLMDIKAAVENS